MNDMTVVGAAKRRNSSVLTTLHTSIMTLARIRKRPTPEKSRANAATTSQEFHLGYTQVRLIMRTVPLLAVQLSGVRLSASRLCSPNNRHHDHQGAACRNHHGHLDGIEDSGDE